MVNGAVNVFTCSDYKEDKDSMGSISLILKKHVKSFGHLK